MNKEATGANGSRLGSSEYWSSINRSTVFGGLMQRDSEPNYCGTLQVIGVRANMMVDEIYEDLQNHIKLLRSIPSDHRSSLAKQVQALYDICRMGGVIGSYAGGLWEEYIVDIQRWSDKRYVFLFEKEVVAQQKLLPR